MINSGCFVKGHKESPETREKRLASCREAWKTREDRHNMMGTKFYNSWRSMTTRCRGTAGEGSEKKYRDKGIRVCERWLKFKNFYEDMFPTYAEGLTIDRIENDKGYYKENCRWATSIQQGNNKTNNVKVEYNGECLTLRDWAAKLTLNLNGLRIKYHHKYSKGLMSVDELFTPISRGGQRRK